MLNKDSEIVLRKLNKINYAYEDLEQFSKLIPKIDKNQIFKTLLYLNDKGYIDCTCSDEEILHIEPTYIGENYFQFEWVSIKQFILKSILTPIVVSVVTTLITFAIRS